MSNGAGVLGGAVSPPTSPGQSPSGVGGKALRSQRFYSANDIKISLNCSTFYISNYPILGPFNIIEMLQYFRLFNKNKAVTELPKVVAGNHLL